MFLGPFGGQTAFAPEDALLLSLHFLGDRRVALLLQNIQQIHEELSGVLLTLIPEVCYEALETVPEGVALDTTWGRVHLGEESLQFATHPLFGIVLLRHEGTPGDVQTVECLQNAAHVTAVAQVVQTHELSRRPGIDGRQGLSSSSLA